MSLSGKNWLRCGPWGCRFPTIWSSSRPNSRRSFKAGQARPRARSWMAGSGAGNEEYGLQLARILLAAGDAEQGTNTMGLDTIEGVRLRALLEELGYEPDFR